MKKYILFAVINIISLFVIAQTKGSIDQKTLDNIRATIDHDAYFKAVNNAVSNGDIKKLALNRENQGKNDHYFEYEVEVKGITDQKQSGRCWMFTGLNVMRPKVMGVYNIGEYEFSTNYLYFWDQFEKANLFLQCVIDSRDKAMNKKQRIITFESGSSHGMALVGVDLDEKEKPVKWKLENSWGSKSGNKGYLTMTE